MTVMHSPAVRIRTAAADFGARAWRGARRLLCLLAVGVLATAAGAWEAHAKKLVGMVFDDSGSMQGRTNLPVFGLQVLTASLASTDRLYGLTFSRFLQDLPGSQIHEAGDARQRGVAPLPLGTTSQQVQSIQTVRGWAVDPKVGTPLGPILTMLRWLGSVSEADDDVHLFLFTDGDFNDGDGANTAVPRLPPQQRLREFMEGVAKTMKAPRLTVHVVVFASDKEKQAIQRQGVLSLMTEVFNGQANQNVIFVDRFDDLYAELVKVVARISETEHERNPAIVEVSGSRVNITPPFSVTKLIALSVGPDPAALPQPSALPANIPPNPPEFLVRMDRPDAPDKVGGGGGQRLHGRITHMQPFPAIEAGKTFSLEFNRPLNEGTRVLFRSDIKIDWAFAEPGGAEIRPDANGVVTLVADRPYEVRAVVIDPLQQGPAKLAGLRDAEFTLSRTDPQKRLTRERMTVDTANNRASRPIRYDEERTDEVSVALRIPGFVTSSGRKVTVQVIRANVDIVLKATPIPKCPACTEKKVEVVLAQGQQWTPAMAVSARFASRGSVPKGVATFSVAQALHPGMRIVILSAGVTLDQTRQEARVPFAMSDEIALQVEVDGNFLQTLVDGAMVDLGLKLDQPLTGAAGISFRVAPKAEDVQLVFAGNTDGGTGNAPFRVKPGEFAPNRGFFVRIERSLDEPAPSQFTMTIGGMKTTIVPQPQKNIMLVVPASTAPLPCCVRTGNYPIRASFKNAKGQTASVAGAMIVEPVTFWERVLLCLWEIIAIILTIYLLAGLWRFIQSHRFPTRSRVLVYPPRQRADAEIRRLAQRPWPVLLPFLLPFKRWDERRVVGGISLQAAADGALILPKRSGYENLRRGAELRPIADYFSGGQSQPLELIWGEKLEERGAERRTYELIKSTQDL